MGEPHQRPRQPPKAPSAPEAGGSVAQSWQSGATSSDAVHRQPSADQQTHERERARRNQLAPEPRLMPTEASRAQPHPLAGSASSVGGGSQGPVRSTPDATTWWPFESEPADPGTKQRGWGGAVAGGWHHVRDGWGDSRWQRAADVVLVTALLIVLGLTALLVIDPDSVTGDSNSSAASVGDAGSGDSPAESKPGQGKTGVQVVNRLRASNNLEVTQWIKFKAPKKELPLANRPAEIGSSDASNVIRDVKVTVDGREVDEQVGPLASGERGTLTLDKASRTFRLDYVVEGAVQRSQPSTTGRALVDLNGLTVRKASGPRLVMVRPGDTGAVLSLACGSSGVAEPCGREGDKGWSVRLSDTAADDDVVASVNLPTG